MAAPGVYSVVEARRHRQADRYPVGTFLLGLFRLLVAYRLELSLLASSVAVWHLASPLTGGTGATLVITSIMALVLGIPRPRQLLVRATKCAHIRRRWIRACRSTGVVAMNDRVPRAVRVREIPAGYEVHASLPRGLTASMLKDASEVLAGAMRIRELRVQRADERASRAYVSLVTRDPLGGTQSIPWPRRKAAQLSIWDPVPVGLDESGETACVRLPERNLLMGGEPGAGKSVALAMFVATAALDPACRLWLFDGKLVELAPWRDFAFRNVGPDVAEANQVLRELRDEMDRRYHLLLASRRRKVAEGDELPLEIVVCDELAMYLSVGDRKLRTEFTELMRDLVARGRAAGVIVLAVTQKPSHDVIPTSLRDLFGFRWALRCSTPQASDTVLGQGWAAQGFSSSVIDPSQRGVGFLLHEGGVPVRVRAFHLSDDDLDEIATRAALVRASHEEGTRLMKAM
jgi:hypothetical protein